MQKPREKSAEYIRERYAGVIESRNRRATGTVVTIYRAADAGLDSAGGDWATVCEDHGAICNHETLAMARAHAPYGEWCEDCNAARYGAIDSPTG